MNLDEERAAFKKKLASRPPYAYVSFSSVSPTSVTLDGEFTVEDLVRIVVLLEKARE